MIEDTFLEILTDMLALLEMGNMIEPTSILHDEFREFMIHYNFISEDMLALKVAELKDDGIEVVAKRCNPPQPKLTGGTNGKAI